jgi:hypothetical protein
MNQSNSIQIDKDIETLFCLPDSQYLHTQDEAEPDTIKLVVETGNYRVEIEIG